MKKKLHVNNTQLTNYEKNEKKNNPHIEKGKAETSQIFNNINDSKIKKDKGNKKRVFEGIIPKNFIIDSESQIKQENKDENNYIYKKEKIIQEKNVSRDEEIIMFKEKIKK